MTLCTLYRTKKNNSLFHGEWGQPLDVDTVMMLLQEQGNIVPEHAMSNATLVALKDKFPADGNGYRTEDTFLIHRYHNTRLHD